MHSFKEIEITGLTISGFKCFRETTELTFGNPTVITGGNGRGKSSIADAIAFAVTGLPFFGERGIDRLHSEGNPNLFISMRFIDEGKKPHELIRSRQKDRMTLTLDGREVRQVDLTGLFGEKDVFLSIFNPLYFIEELEDDGKKLLERYLPEIPKETVLAQLSEAVRETLRGEEFLSPEDYLKKKREEIRELEKTAIYLRGQQDLVNHQKEQACNRLAELRDRMTVLEAEKAELEERHFAGLEPADLQDQLVSLSIRYEELARKSAPAAETSGIDDRLSLLQKKVGERAAQEYIPKYSEQSALCAAKVQEFGSRYKRETALLRKFRSGTACPACRRSITEQELPAVQTSLQELLNEIIRQGKDAKSQLEELTMLEKKAEETFFRFKVEDLKRLEEEIDLLTKQRCQILADAEKEDAARQAEIDTLRQQIQSISAQAEYGMLSPEEYHRLEQCSEEIDALRAEILAVQPTVTADPGEYDEKLRQLEGQISFCKKLIADVSLYVSKRAELLLASLKMNWVDISLFDVVKSTGEVKDVFKFTYKGRRYDRLSLSEKVRAGMEVSELIKSLTGRNYPQFIDNMESVDELNNVKPTGQVIMAKCIRGTPFSVRIPDREQHMPKAA